MEMIRKIFCKPRMGQQQGMTLIELMIAVVVVGILAAISYPSYTKYVVESYRTMAKADMAKIQLALEHNYNNGYSWGQIISGSSCLICDTPSDRYTFSIASAAAPTYTIIATASTSKGQSKDACLEADKKMKLDSTNKAEPTACWK
ncbi:prepilin-type N-terminal cleavage/methylation domain-containing protein [Vibrio mimicus]|nr:type IV pilin protein [Vibrio mimicus]QXC56856.1 prepilin-type N-terminal cleavage/methylation domain-containing protein [Vibrio mimicus]